MGGMGQEKKSMGPLVGIVIVVLILIAGAVYAFVSSQPSVQEGSPAVMEEKKTTEQYSAGTVTETPPAVDASVSALSVQGASSDLPEIQKDMQASDFSGLDAGFSDISSSL